MSKSYALPLQRLEGTLCLQPLYYIFIWQLTGDLDSLLRNYLRCHCHYQSSRHMHHYLIDGINGTKQSRKRKSPSVHPPIGLGLPDYCSRQHDWASSPLTLTRSQRTDNRVTCESPLCNTE